jgi:predicted transcriptional regulator
MEVQLPRHQEAQLNELAARTGRGTDELMQEAVAQLLARNEHFKQRVQVGIDQIARGEFIEEEDMDARVERHRWSPTAADDLEQIRSYYAEHFPSHAQSTVKRHADTQ